MNNKLSESLEILAKDSKLTLIEYLANRAEYVRFFSYGGNMNKEKFKADMEKAANDLKLKLSKNERTRLELDKFSKKRILVNFKRGLSNESEQHGLAFSICSSLNSKVGGICHNVHVSALPAFLKKEGLLSSKGTPSYKLIKIHVLGEDQEVLTLLGLKPKSLKDLAQQKILNALEYVNKSITGAEEFHVGCSDMVRVKKMLEEMKDREET